MLITYCVSVHLSCIKHTLNRCECSAATMSVGPNDIVVVCRVCVHFYRTTLCLSITEMKTQTVDIVHIRNALTQFRMST